MLHQGRVGCCDLKLRSLTRLGEHCRYPPKEGMECYTSGRDLLRSVRQFIADIRKSIANGESLIVESTLAGKPLRHLIAEAGSQGYHITVIFAFLNSADTCVDRVEQRVKLGGTMCLNPIFADASHAQFQTSGMSIVIWRISGYWSIIMQEVRLATLLLATRQKR